MSRREKTYLIPSHRPEGDDPRDILMERDRLEAIIESSFDGIYITDGSAVTIMINKSYEAISGLRREEVLGKDMRTLETTGVISRSGTLLAIEAGTSVTLEQTFKTGRRAIITSTPTFDQDNNIVMVVTNVRDVTEMYALKGQLEESWAQSKQYRDELEAMRRRLGSRPDLIAVDAATIATIRTADKLAPLDATVLIVGERGVGKSTVAKYIHSKSARKKGKFVTVSCGAIPPETMNEELFGVARDGEVRPGLFETGSGGTIFLNEVGELPPDIQMKVCRLIHEKTITRVGSPDPVRVDARVLASTSHDLEQLTAEKKLQEEFYYCLNALPVEVPPLRRRREDIIPFVQFFASELNKKYNMKKKFSQTALLGLKSYDWPGNVRELHNVVERTIVLSGRNPIELEDLPISDEIRLEDEDLAELTEPVDLRAILRQVERSYLDRAYARFGNVRDAAKSLGLDPSTFVRRRKRDAQ